MIPRLRQRAPGTRTARTDPRGRRLESLAGEFALLAQRRARMSRQLELLDQQRAAALHSFSQIECRLQWLNTQMAKADPDLQNISEVVPIPEEILPARGHHAVPIKPLGGKMNYQNVSHGLSAAARLAIRPRSGHGKRSG